MTVSSLLSTANPRSIRAAELVQYDLAIHGHGMIPGLVALHLLKRNPEQTVLLLAADDKVGGNALEPVVRSSLSSDAYLLIEPFIVAQWPGYLVSDKGDPDHHHDEVILLDPVQLSLELSTVFDPHDMTRTNGPLTVNGKSLSWAGGQAQALELVDLASLTRQDQECEILGLDAARSLSLPVLADFDTGHEPWNAFQHIPLGDERVFVRKRRFRGNAYAELIGGFGKLLSDLIAY